ncbi:MAG TPA: hypothetical protein VGR96_03485, partial [Acidobacteriaceae bacterium]|nr:hypothetical protein [Acidobacteriaceae bacterium]
LALHILRDLLAGDWIVNHVHELAVFLHHHAEDDEFWKTWMETHSPALRSLEAIAFFHANAWFSCRLPGDVEAEIAALAPDLKQWLRRFSGSSLESMFIANKDRVWLHMALLRSPGERWRILRRVLFPARVPALHTAAASVKNRRSRKTDGLHPLARYFCYFAERTTAHLYLLPVTLCHGLGWWFSRRQPGRPFWIFLAASFFLTWACLSTFCSSICF